MIQMSGQPALSLLAIPAGEQGDTVQVTLCLLCFPFHLWDLKVVSESLASLQSFQGSERHIPKCALCNSPGRYSQIIAQSAKTEP